MTSRRPPVALLLALALTPPPALAWAGAQAGGGLEVQNAWSRPATPGLPGVGYLTLVNHGAAPERLVGASTPKAAAVSLHRSGMSKGVMTMSPLPDGVEVAPGATVRFAPGGYHLMLMGLKDGLKLGERYPMTLRFAHARSRTVQVEVRTGAEEPPAAKAP